MYSHTSFCLPYVKKLKHDFVTYNTLDNRKIHNCPASIKPDGKYIFVPTIELRIKTIEKEIRRLDIQEVSYSDYYVF